MLVAMTIMRVRIKKLLKKGIREILVAANI
jgi:hypothetical protein